MRSGRTGIAFLVLATAGCADVAGPLQVDQKSGTSANAAPVLPRMLAGFFSNVHGNGASCYPNDASTEIPSQVQSAVWIDANGGEVSISGTDSADRPVAHMLVVPPNTVTQRTLFCMRLDPSNHLSVDLSAHTIAADGSVVNVGKYGLPKPVELYMAYSPADVGVVGGPRPVIIYVPESGPMEELNCPFKPFGYVHAELRLLSKYALALD